MEKFNIKEVLSELCAADGVSGAEENAAKKAAEYLSYYGKTEIDDFNNVYCSVGVFDESKPTLMLNAHIDEIGMIVTYVTDDGFVKVSKCGGIDERVLPAAQVTVLGKERLKGVFTSVPPHLSKGEDKAASLDDLYIDLGLDGKTAKDLVSLGDRALIENTLEPLQGDYLTSKALDDRACVCCVLKILDLLVGKETAFNIKVLFSTKEETGSQGAKIGAFRSGADYALIFDVSFGKVHGESNEDVGECSKGAMIGISPVLSRKLSNALIGTAKEKALPYQIEVMGSRTGTDADAVSLSKDGIAACTVSIPIKNMHTPVEAVKICDIENTAALAAEFIERGFEP